MLRVQCPQCKRVCHKTTVTYNPDIRPNGGMVELVEPYISRGLEKFGDNCNGSKSVLASEMECPLCQAPLAPSGRLRIAPDLQPVKTQTERNQEAIDILFTPIVEEEPVGNPLVCKICGKECKSKLGLHSHMRSHKND